MHLAALVREWTSAEARWPPLNRWRLLWGPKGYPQGGPSCSDSTSDCREVARPKESSSELPRRVQGATTELS